MTMDRAQESHRVRVEAADLARNRNHPQHQSNQDEPHYATAHYPMCFTKGLEHDKDLGLVLSPTHFQAFRAAIDAGEIEAFTTKVPVPTAEPRRQWEAPTAGVVYDLEGPDAQAVTMAPAPELCSDELTFEMAEVYELALLRDVPLLSFDQNGGPGSSKINDSIARLHDLDYAKNGFPNRPRTTDSGQLTRQNAFRGSSPGVDLGPYLSQFLWIGGGDQIGVDGTASGKISFGAQLIDQKVPEASAQDFMQKWSDWLRVQQGYDVNAGSPGQTFTGTRRLIYTPRDLATYVHYDALYQAYLNACLLLLGMGTPLDPGFAHLSGNGLHFDAIHGQAVNRNAGGFALFGGPHILTLVTEVATRALKAVRFQKFNNHIRLRPEALAARIARASEIDTKHPSTGGAFGKVRDQLQTVLAEIDKHNGSDSDLPNGNYLLPMAFAEGSPMHPAYGAGHATVAGACVTILKAYFDTGTLFGRNITTGKDGFYSEIDEAIFYQAQDTGASLDRKSLDVPLTLEGELNKLAANISIGRNMAGVHYYSDYYDSLRMGEEIAIGMLEEQALCYPTDDFVMSVPTFDGRTVRIGRR